MAGFAAKAQTCDVEIPAGNWAGETTSGYGGNYGSGTVSVSVSGLDVTVSDFSAGLFAEFGDDQNYSKTLSFDCDGQMSSQEFSSSYGTIRLTAGSWNASTEKITISWTIPESQLNETTILTYTGQ